MMCLFGSGGSCCRRSLSSGFNETVQSYPRGKVIFCLCTVGSDCMPFELFPRLRSLGMQQPIAVVQVGASIGQELSEFVREGIRGGSLLSL